MKTFRNYIRRNKEVEEHRESREAALTYARPPPAGWSIKTFLSEMQIGDNLDEIAQGFESWSHFVSATPEDFAKVEVLTTKQKRQLWKYIGLFNHGLWPEQTFENYAKNFQVAPPENEGASWTPEDDEQLRKLADLYDTSFGDPWLYISWAMKRSSEEVHDRYTQICLQPKQRTQECELVVTTSCRPLFMSRKFKLDPPFVYVVPSRDNFPLSAVTDALPEPFRRFRRKECFGD